MMLALEAALKLFFVKRSRFLVIPEEVHSTKSLSWFPDGPIDGPLTDITSLFSPGGVVC
jgi:hypothetical protein